MIHHKCVDEHKEQSMHNLLYMIWCLQDNLANNIEDELSRNWNVVAELMGTPSFHKKDFAHF